MKTTVLLALLAASGFAATGCSSTSLKRVATHSSHSLGLPLDEVPADEAVGQRTLQLHPGNTREAVLTQLGVPQAAAGQDVWIYPGAASADSKTRALGYDTLVVTFSEDRVIHLRLVNGHQAREVLARARGEAAAPALLAQVP
jgi:hypothetical protein